MLQTGLIVWPTIAAVLYSISAVPITYMFNTYTAELAVTARFFVSLLLVTGSFLVVYITTRHVVKNKLYYALAVLCFSSGIDNIIAFELEGHISGFMGLYIEFSEPYLNSVPQIFMCFYNGIIHFLCYIIMIYCLTNGKSFKYVGCFYSSSALNRMLVVLLAISVGKTQWTLSTLLNVPFLIFPLIILASCLKEERKQKILTTSSTVIDKLFSILLLAAAGGAFIKGMICLGNERPLFLWYEREIEPLLTLVEPAPIPYIQGLVTLFYFLPMYVIAAIGILKYPGYEWLRILSALLAGATLHAGIMTIGSSIHPLTDSEYSAPSDTRSWTFVAFWGLNLIMTLTPQLVAFKILYCSQTSTSKYDVTTNIKKNK